MKYTLTAATFFCAMTIAPAYGQAWLGQVVAETAAAQERTCMRGETRPPSERRLAPIRESLTGSMTRYLALAAAGESSDVSSFTECFLTGSAAEVTPVGQIGNWNFEVGNITRTLMDDYSNFVRGKHRI